MLNPNDPGLESWVDVKKASDFPIQNLPYGIFKKEGESPKAGIAIGEFVLDLAYLHKKGYFNTLDFLPEKVFENKYLNDFIALPKQLTSKFRAHIAFLLSRDNPTLRNQKEDAQKALIPQSDVAMQMPVFVRDYTDFYSSIEHATNVGKMFRDPEHALLPNWKHLPVGYHGRASSIVVSGTPIHRPNGQTKAPDAPLPTFGPTKRLDFELEMAFVTCKSNMMGKPISTAEAEDHIFGFVLFNDWSARDIQVWEYVPLGPFLAKNFASSISPWIVTLDALEPYREKGPKQDPEVLPYLAYEGAKNFNINLQVAIKPDTCDEKVVCNSNFRYMYWNINQQLAHHTVNGCNIGVGDLYASGTISGATPDSYGSMLELAWKGTKPILMADGSSRKFIEDGDTVIMRGYADKNGVRIGFGELSTRVLK